MNVSANARARWGVRGSAWLGLAMLAGMVGCRDSESAPPSASVYEVKGKVLLRDGKPLSSGRVVFVAQEAPAVSATGELGPDGSFTLTSLRPDDGAVPGKYKVRIEPG